MLPRTAPCAGLRAARFPRRALFSTIPQTEGKTMRDSLDPRRRIPGRARTLLLTLALAACDGGGGGGAGEGGDTADAAQPQAALSKTGGDGNCSPPPIIPNSLVVPGASWANLEKFLTDSAVTFPDTPDNTAVATVPLCPGAGCGSTSLRLQSTDRTFCLDSVRANQQRIAGRMTVLTPYPGGGGVDPLPAQAVIYMLSRGNPGRYQVATLVYNNNGQVKQMPPGSWRFYYCADGEVGTKPRAQWRPETVTHGGGTRGPRDGGGGGGGTYGWMACANGCCQFYTPPPSTEFPELPDKGNTPDSIPPWCRPKQSS